ncbi:MAG: hypothetical protein WA687_04645 [Solirubrobacterales bacterium]
MAKYAVLWEINGQASRPIGLAIDLGDYVYVEVPDSYGIPHRFDGEYRVLQPDSTHMVYRPGEEGYLEQILVDLSSLFAIGDRGLADISNNAALIALLTEKVFKPREESRVGDYAVGLPDGCPSYVREHMITGFEESDEESTSMEPEPYLIAA